jgi:hypothetical protein
MAISSHLLCEQGSHVSMQTGEEINLSFSALKEITGNTQATYMTRHYSTCDLIS